MYNVLSVAGGKLNSGIGRPAAPIVRSAAFGAVAARRADSTVNWALKPAKTSDAACAGG